MNWIDCRGEWWSIIVEGRKSEREKADLEKAPKGNPSKLADRAEIGIFFLPFSRTRRTENDERRAIWGKEKWKMCKCILQWNSNGEKNINDMGKWNENKLWNYLFERELSWARKGNKNLALKLPFPLHSLSAGIIKPETLLMFISANWSFHIKLVWFSAHFRKLHFQVALHPRVLFD